MDSAFARGRHAAVMAVLLVACSSGSSNGGDPGASDGDGGHVTQDPDAASEGGSAGAGGHDAAVDYDAAIAACASDSIPMQRLSCCEQEIPGGYFTRQLAEQACLCGTSGACASACTYQDCIGLQSSAETCQSCLDTNLAGSCKGKVDSACAADPGCVAYEACVQGGGV